MLFFRAVVLFLVILGAFAGPVARLAGRRGREVGGSVSRNFPGHGLQERERSSREVGGAITRNYPGNLPLKRDLDIEEEIWTVVQSDEENLTMDNVRGKDVPLSLTEDFRGIEPVMPVDDYVRVFM